MNPPIRPLPSALAPRAAALASPQDAAHLPAASQPISRYRLALRPLAHPASRCAATCLVSLRSLPCVAPDRASRTASELVQHDLFARTLVGLAAHGAPRLYLAWSKEPFARRRANPHEVPQPQALDAQRAPRLDGQPLLDSKLEAQPRMNQLRPLFNFLGRQHI
eukprot:CAMPEP_0115857150 /NCGR_PEP_ID=MMETSP0287-20121206/15424_1 /TAXON_ID=412157 /ORGANISM="Chrysochromulina rotalis, Strain UIO044" /LENGTH=163 /DNA_ID=CAMNT_0003311355 /DNA_START=798 /DNA_END=1287 /DNA_ORIENTATION=+